MFTLRGLILLQDPQEKKAPRRPGSRFLPLSAIRLRLPRSIHYNALPAPGYFYLSGNRTRPSCDHTRPPPHYPYLLNTPRQPHPPPPLFPLTFLTRHPFLSPLPPLTRQIQR